MATIKQATNALLDGVVISATATGLVTRELAGTAVDTAKQARKTVNLAGKAIDYADELMSRELAELQLANASELEYLKDIYGDENTQKKIKAKMEKSILAKYEEESQVEITF